MYLIYKEIILLNNIISLFLALSNFNKGGDLNENSGGLRWDPIPNI